MGAASAFIVMGLMLSSDEGAENYQSHTYETQETSDYTVEQAIEMYELIKDEPLTKEELLVGYGFEIDFQEVCDTVCGIWDGKTFYSSNSIKRAFVTKKYSEQAADKLDNAREERTSKRKALGDLFNKYDND